MTRKAINVNITEQDAEDILINICIGEDAIIAVEFERCEDGTLYLTAWETANPDSDGVIENHYPEFFSV